MCCCVLFMVVCCSFNKDVHADIYLLTLVVQSLMDSSPTICHLHSVAGRWSIQVDVSFYWILECLFLVRFYSVLTLEWPRSNNLISSLDSSLDDILIILGCVVFAFSCCRPFCLTSAVRWRFVAVVWGSVGRSDGRNSFPKNEDLFGRGTLAIEVVVVGFQSGIVL